MAIKFRPPNVLVPHKKRMLSAGARCRHCGIEVGGPGRYTANLLCNLCSWNKVKNESAAAGGRRVRADETSSGSALPPN